MKISIFGHVCIDKNISEHSQYMGAGSPAMFISKTFRESKDCDVKIISTYGTDFLKYLNDVSIFPTIPNGDKTLAYENITIGSKRTQKARFREQAVSPTLSQELFNTIKQTDIAFFTPLLPNYSKDYIQQIVNHLDSDSLKILLPQGYFRDFDSDDNVTLRNFDEADQILPYMDIVIASEQDYPDIIETQKKWALSHNIISIVTLGEKGAIAFQGEKTIHLPTQKVRPEDIIDSVGSGDIFAAGFGYQYKLSKDVKQSGDYANKLARQCLFSPASTRTLFA